MKASMKFREEKKPILKAKIPLSILGLPFQSGIVAGETKELSLNLSTFFESGPSLKIAYRPNDTWNPFSVIFKTGTGSFGSPISSSMLMSAEFNLLGNGNPSFMLHFKPRFGDFSIKKSHSSSDFDSNVLKSVNGSVSEEDSSIEVVDAPTVNGFGGAFRKVKVLPSACAGDIAGLISGVDVGARTSLPVRGSAVVKFRWGIKVPTEINPTAAISLKRIPFLVMNKIGIEHVDGKETKSANNPGRVSDPGLPGNADVAEACLAVRRQMEELRTENSQLKRSVEDLRQEITNVRPFPSTPMDFGSSRYCEDEKSSNAGKSKAEELKKAVKGSP